MRRCINKLLIWISLRKLMVLRNSSLYIRGDIRKFKCSSLLLLWEVIRMFLWDCYVGTRSMLILGISLDLKYLVDCSIQISEMLKHQGSLSEAADLIGML